MNQILGIVQPCGYRVFAIRKSPFATQLQACEAIVPAATDYAVIRDDLLGRSGVRKLLLA